MGADSKIEWTDATWNPIVGCGIVSPGCTNCYAMRMAARIDKMTLASHYAGLTQPSKAGPVWTGKLAMANDHVLTAPLRRRKPTMWFVNSMGDLFHEAAPDDWIDRVFAVMALASQHVFQILTKRPERMRAYIESLRPTDDRPWDRITDIAMDMGYSVRGYRGDGGLADRPLPNVWLGVSTERQQEADERIPLLLQTPAAVRFLSAEPLLGPIDLHKVIPDALTYNFVHERRGLDWIIAGGESGPHARPMNIAWVRAIVDQCKAAGVACFVKQLGAWPFSAVRDGPFQAQKVDDMRPGSDAGPFYAMLQDRKGGDPAEWPMDLQRVRQMPEVRRG